MDIHTVDSDDFSAEDVALAHVKDIAVQEKFGVTQIKYWINLENKTIFCLMEGPDKESCNNVHKESHGDTACNIIEVKDDEFNLFLGVGTSKSDLAYKLSGELDTGYRTLLLISTLDFTGKYSHYTNQIHRLIQNHNGIIVLQPCGDIMVSFISASDAIICAKNIFKLLKSISDYYLYKVAIMTGKPVDEFGTNLFEDTKKKIQYLCKIGSNDFIYLDNATKLLSDKESNSSSIDQKYFRVINEVNFLFLTKLFNILKCELYNSDFKSAKLHSLLGLSKSQAYRKITSLTGMPPNTFIQELRLHQAIKEIKNNNKTIAEIGYDLGFNSPTYFTRIFKKKFGVLPTSIPKEFNN
jgi:AraC-like DNA-binding protein